MAVTDLDRRTAFIALQEWWFFGSQFVNGDDPDLPIENASGSHRVDGDERKGGFKQRVWTYFKYGVFPDSDGWIGKKPEPWSAAFISFCMRCGGAAAQFPYSSSHSDYVRRAVKNRQTGATANAIVAYDIKEQVPTVGDLLWKGRKGNAGEIDTTGWTYADLVNYANSHEGSVPSHCDLVVQTETTKGFLYVIGGNVSNTVLRMKIAINSDGAVTSKRYAAIIKNNISE